ncbi:MAG: thioredoxin-disulfide reductase, partial [Firmicutes bacterium]|nr:thioredoxin-disulfide reductase [Bacillota bacterium]
NRAFANVVSLDKEGFIMAENCVTGTAGVFAAGDCRVKKYRQLTTAVSDGATAALLACEYCDGIE